MLYKQLSHTAVSQFCTQLTTAYEAETSCNQVVADFATHLSTQDQFVFLYTHLWIYDVSEADVVVREDT